MVTLFKFDEELGLNVPAEMRDWYPDGAGELRGVATYGKFRRFQVRTDETVQKSLSPWFVVRGGPSQH